MFHVPTPTVMPSGDVSLRPSQQLQPTPTLVVFSGYGSGFDDYTYFETTEDSATFPSPVSPSTATQHPPDVIIRLRLSFESNITVGQRTQVGQNLLDIVKEILQLSIPPSVRQESDDVFSLLIVTSSSNFDNITSGDVDTIKTVLQAGKLVSRLQGVTVSLEFLSYITKFVFANIES